MAAGSPEPRFRWHPAARVTGPDGGVVAPTGAPYKQVPCGAPHNQAPDVAPRDTVHDGLLRAIPDRPIGPSLAQVMGSALTGQPFCVHPTGMVVTGREDPGHFQCTTSGSTGRPKRIRRHMATWLRNFDTNTGRFGLSAQDRYAVPGALSHSLTLYAACEALHIGADLRLLDGIRPDRQARALAEGRTTVLYATPTQLRQLNGPPCPNLRLVLVGGGALDRHTAAGAARLFPQATIHVFYGASETSFITIGDATTPDGSVGRPYPGVHVAIRDAKGNLLPNGTDGEIWIESPTLFAGYADGERGATRRDGAALTVGEHGYLDPAGHLWLTGRGDRMFQVADQRIHPEEIEAMLLGLPGVDHAAVLPRPDAARGQIPVALISGGIETDMLLSRARTALGPTKAPRAVIRVADWPILPSGKTDLRRLESLL